MKTFIGSAGFAFLDERELRLRSRWFHYSTLDVFSQFFRSPDWRLWQQGRYPDAVRAMLDDTELISRHAARARTWADAGVRVTRAQVVDAEAASRLEHPVNYLLTYLAATHPGEDRLVIDAARASRRGVDLPETDFLLHDDDLVMTKYAGADGVARRDLYLNQEPQPGEDDDRPFYAGCREAADRLLSLRAEITWTGALPGLALLEQIRDDHGTGEGTEGQQL